MDQWVLILAISREDSNYECLVLRVKCIEIQWLIELDIILQTALDTLLEKSSSFYLTSSDN
jgi:hypothetical protein